MKAAYAEHPLFFEQLHYHSCRSYFIFDIMTEIL